MNKESTRAYSTKHEESVCRAIGGYRQPQSGGGKFRKGDVIAKDSSLLVECKCSMSPKESFSIKKEWLEKNREEMWTQRLSNNALCFTFEPNGQNYYVIDERLMKYLVEKLREEDE